MKKPFPYYTTDDVAIYQGDCLRVLPSLPPGSVDLILTDPPYGDTSLGWDVPVRRWLPLAARCLKPNGSLWCFGSLRTFLAHAAEFRGWRLAQDVVWEKHNGSSFHADRFRRVHEHAVQFYPATTRWRDVYKAPVMTNDAVKRVVRQKTRPPHLGRIGESVYTSEDGGPKLMRSVFHVRSCHGYAVHPTQKPVDVLLPLLRYSCPPGGLVLDPFLGSGSTLVAARRLGLRAIGVEREEGYCAATVARLTSPTEEPAEDAA